MLKPDIDWGDFTNERFSEGSEAVVLLSVVLSGLPVGIVLLE